MTAKREQFAAAAADFMTRSPAQRAEAAEEFLRTWDSHLQAKAHQLIRTRGLPADMFDDVAQIVRQAHWQFLVEESPGALTSPAGLMYRRSTQELSRHLQEMGPVSGMRSKMRKASAAQKTRHALMMTLGREPTDEEVVQAYNTRMRATRKDPERQGALLSPDDLHTVQTIALEVEDVDVQAYGRGQIDPDGAESAALMRSVMASTILRCKGMSAQLGDIAFLLMAPTMVHGDDPPPLVDVGRQLGLAEASLYRQSQVIRQVLLEEMDEVARRSEPTD